MLYIVVLVKLFCIIQTIIGIIKITNRFVNEMPHLSNDFYKDFAFWLLSCVLSAFLPKTSMVLDAVLLIATFARYIFKKNSSR